MSETVISVRGLVKEYGELKAVNDISFDVYGGEVFSFLGPNGAGKTTTVEIIETIRDATSGEIDVLDLDLKKQQKEVLQRIGVLPQEFRSFKRQTVAETLEFFSSLFSMQCDVDRLLTLVNLMGHRDKQYQTLSGGLKQRVGIAVALVNDPEIVFLDEPTTGLDPKARRDVWEVIRGLKKEGKTVFLTTHYMEEAEVLSDRVAIMSKGKIIDRGTPSELIEKYSNTLHATIRGGGEGVLNAAESMGLPAEVLEDGIMSIEATSNDQIIDFLNRLRSDGVKYSGMGVRKPNLEEVFLALTGEALSEEGAADIRKETKKRSFRGRKEIGSRGDVS